MTDANSRHMPWALFVSEPIGAATADSASARRALFSPAAPLICATTTAVRLILKPTEEHARNADA
jgi:hypothetical protein